MENGLALAIMIGSLVVAAWCLVPVVRDRWIDLTHLAGLAAVEVAVVVQAVIAVVRIAGGTRPVEFSTFVGYLAAAVLLLPFAVVLAFLERTRWGAVIVAAGAFVVAVVMLRLQQVWTPLR